MKLLSLIFLLLMSCDNLKVKPKIKKSELELLQNAKENFEPLPHSMIDKKKFKERIELGEKLYFEAKLSKNGKISCNSCHDLKNFGVDNEPTSPGHDGRRGGRNSPTSLNSSVHISQFWDGRAKDVEEQALGPLLNPIEHGLASEKEALSKIDSQEYREAFKRAFPGEKDSFTFVNIGRAIGAFERTLLTPSRFDQYLKGAIGVLTQDEKKGLDLFMDRGCISCHTGVGIGGSMYMKMGLVKDYPLQDKGLYDLTGDEDDLHVFKVPGLRNIVHTGPYMHNGKIESLHEMIRIMAEYQLDEKLTDQEVFYIKAFLGSLSGKTPQKR